MPKIFVLAALVLSVAIPALAATPSGEAVTINSTDNVAVSATFFKGKAEKGPAVVLVHMLGRSRADWTPILEKYLLPEAPFSYLAIDLRGHGDSTKQDGKTISYSEFSTKEWNGAVADVAAAVAYLRSRPDVDGDKIAIVGASIGANLALRYAAFDPKIRAIALLSPGGDYHGVTVGGTVMKAYGDRPIFLAASHEDSPANDTVPALAQLSKGTKVVEIYPGTLHGTKMFGAQPLDKQLTDFLKEYLK